MKYFGISAQALYDLNLVTGITITAISVKKDFRTSENFAFDSIKTVSGKKIAVFRSLVETESNEDIAAFIGEIQNNIKRLSKDLYSGANEEINRILASIHFESQPWPPRSKQNQNGNTWHLLQYASENLAERPELIKTIAQDLIKHKIRDLVANINININVVDNKNEVYKNIEKKNTLDIVFNGHPSWAPFSEVEVNKNYEYQRARNVGAFYVEKHHTIIDENNKNTRIFATPQAFDQEGKESNCLINLITIESQNHIYGAECLQEGNTLFFSGHYTNTPYSIHQFRAILSQALNKTNIHEKALGEDLEFIKIASYVKNHFPHGSLNHIRDYMNALNHSKDSNYLEQNADWKKKIDSIQRKIDKNTQTIEAGLSQDKINELSERIIIEFAKIDKIKKIEINGSILNVYTKALKIYPGYKGKEKRENLSEIYHTRKGGEYLLQFDINRGCPPTIKNLSRNINGAPHPHIQSGPCWGNMHAILNQLLNEYEYPAIVIMLIAYLETCNVDDAWGRTVRYWPLDDGRSSP